MKPFVLIILSLFGLNAVAQDTSKFYFNKEEIVKQTLSSQIYRVDTIFADKDSILVHYFSKNQKLLKKEKVNFVTSNIEHPPRRIAWDSSIVVFNQFELPFFLENWICAAIIYDTEGGGKGGNDFMQIGPGLHSKIRIEYDNNGREKLLVTYFSSLQTTTRITRLYNSDGEMITSHSEEIPDSSFWAD